MSLLKRIEQGQTKPTDPSLPQKPGASVPPAGAQADQGGVLGGLQARRAPATSTSPQPGSYFDLKTRVQNRLLAELDPSMDITRTEDVRRTIMDLFEQILNEENIVLTRPERQRL